MDKNKKIIFFSIILFVLLATLVGLTFLVFGDYWQINQKKSFVSESWNMPESWVAQEGCEGLIFFHPPDMNFFSYPGTTCSVDTPGGGIKIFAAKSKNIDNAKKSNNVIVDGVAGRRYIKKNVQEELMQIDYIFYKWDYYYHIKADLENRDYSMTGNFELYQDYPEIAEIFGGEKTHTIISEDEFIALFDYIVSTIEFTTPPKVKEDGSIRIK
ncbi:hypothetical protein KO465_06150 [Candidatus Micrarchaeota archaeon]|nr:hypothetical protein [Candidatus Micrarchaeota archaeon]